ncbi:MAG TPA: YraN family protein [Candidatus Latescibacteria bacterium]|nr:YraN family protein [Candidatus Latescibacterota bacterium]
MQRTERGTSGEDLAAKWLEGKGIKVLARNFRARGGEVDIVAKDGDVLAFVEVKTGRSGAFGPPESWVTLRKRAHLVKAAQVYLAKNPWDGDVRFDVVAVEVGKCVKIRHIKDAFRPE